MTPRCRICLEPLSWWRRFLASPFCAICVNGPKDAQWVNLMRWGSLYKWHRDLPPAEYERLYHELRRLEHHGGLAL